MDKLKALLNKRVILALAALAISVGVALDKAEVVKLACVAESILQAEVPSPECAGE